MNTMMLFHGLIGALILTLIYFTQTQTKTGTSRFYCRLLDEPGLGNVLLFFSHR